MESLIDCPDRLVPAARKVGLSRLEDAGNLGLRVGTDDDLRHEAVEARVGAPGQATELVGVDPALRYEVAYLFQE